MRFRDIIEEKRSEIEDSLLSLGDCPSLGIGALEIERKLQDNGSIPLPEGVDISGYLDGDRLTLGLVEISSGDIRACLAEVTVRVTEESGIRSLVRTDEEIVCNRALIDAVREKTGIDISNRRPFCRIDCLYSDARKALSGTYFQILDNSYLVLPVAREYLRYCRGDLSSSRVIAIADGDYSGRTTYRLSSSDVYPFANAYEVVDNRFVCLAECESDDLKALFLKDALNTYLRDGKSILVAAKDRETADFIRGRITDMGLGLLLGGARIGDTGYRLDKEAISLSASEGPEVSEDAIARVERSRNLSSDLLSSLSTANISGTIVTGEDSITGLNKFSYYRSLRRTSFKLDTEYYTPADYDRDVRFFETIKDYRYVYLASLKECPMHSYRAVVGDQRVYQAMIDTLNKSAKDLDEFRDLLDKSGISQLSESPIDSLTSFTDIRATAAILLRYDGFPMTLFDSADETDAMPLALRLNTVKDSMDVLFEEICERVKDINTLSDEPLADLLKDLDSDKYMIRRRARRTLKRMLREPARIDSFIDTLREYMELTSEFDECMAKAENIFGMVLYANDGPKRVLSSLEFISDYRRITSEHPILARENNTFVQRIFEDRDFRESEREILRDADYAADALRADATALSDFFSDTIVSEEIPFDEIARRIRRRASIQPREFSEYSDFVSALEKASYCLKQAVDIYDGVDLSLSALENDYWYSLYRSIALSTRRDSEDIYRVMSAMVDARDDAVSVESKETFDAVQARAREVWWNSDVGAGAQRTCRMAPHAQASQVLDSYWDLALTISPLQVCSMDELPPVEGRTFDICLIVDPEGFSDQDLALFLSWGERVLIVSDLPEVDPRLSRIDRVEISLEGLYRGPLDYSLLSEDFLNLFASGFDLNGFELQTAEEYGGSMPLSYVGKDGVRRCVIPFVLIGQRQTRTAVIGADRTLISLGLPPLVLSPSMQLVIDPEATIRKLDEGAEEFGRNALEKVKKG